MSEPVLYDVEDGVATLTLNRPDNRNALTESMSNAIIDAVDRAEDDEDVRCLVVTGKEGTFCAGGDVNAMVGMMSGAAELHEAVERIQHNTHRAIQRVAEFHLPTVAKVDGVAYGAGANLAIATDVPLASTDASISFGFRQVGLAVDSGTSYLLPRIVGENKAKELVFTGELLSAEDAGEEGIFNHVYDADEFDTQADELIESIATGPTIALRTSKQAISQGLNTSLKDALDNEAALQAQVFATADHEEGATAFMEGREAEFQGE
jgi:enoyl-CoA hydratase/carnithine racemase